MDVTDQGAAFSALHIIQTGRDLGVPIGHQFNPSLLARVLKARSRSREDMPFDVYHVRNGIINEAALRKRGKPILLLIPLRLGAAHLNPEYCALIKASLASPYSLGIIGGRAARAFYIVGYQDESLLYLDPHVLQRSCTNMDEIIRSRQYHTRTVCELFWPQLNPTLLFGFLCRGPSEADGLIKSLWAVPVPMPVFSFVSSSATEGGGGGGGDEEIVFRDVETMDDSAPLDQSELTSWN